MPRTRDAAIGGAPRAIAAPARIARHVPGAAAVALGGGLLAGAASVAALLVTRPIVDPLGRALLGSGAFADYAVTGFIAALAWVWAGAQAARDRRRRLWLAMLLLVVGAVVARRLVWTVNTSPFHGLAELAAAYAGGGIGVVLAVAAGVGGRRRPAIAAVAAGVLLPIAAFAVTTAHAWQAAQHGRFGYLHLDDERRVPVRWIDVAMAADDPAARRIVLWVDGAAAAAVGRAAEGALGLETDLGSGAWGARLTPSAPGVRARVERAVDADLRRTLDAEVRAGYTAPVFRAVAMPRAKLGGASFFDVAPR